MPRKSKVQPRIPDRFTVLRAWPIYGGTTPEPTPAATVTVAPAATPPAESTPPAPEPTPTPDPLETLRNDPNALQQLLSQVDNLNTQIKGLTTENDKFKTEKADAERKQQTKEQQLETDLNNERIKNEKLINLLNQKLLENALATMPDYQWHDARDALSGIDTEQLQIDIDIDKGVANIEGMEAQVKDLAKRKPWLLKKGPTDPTTTTSTTPRNQPVRPSTGAPPAGPTNDAAKVKRRAELIAKHPVIAQGRR